MTQRILFLCTGNSARSQLAEAVALAKLGDQFEVFSAGTRPQDMEPRTLAVLAEAGYPTANLTPKSLDDFGAQPFDFVITLCEEASKECQAFPNATKMLAWNLPDPRPQEGIEPFETALAEIEHRIDLFNQVHGHQAASLEHTIAFHKALGEAMRLRCVLLLSHRKALSVGEMVNALQEIQPKVSRSLGQLKKQGIVKDCRQAQKVYYCLAPTLAPWQRDIIRLLADSHQDEIQANLALLDDNAD